MQISSTPALRQLSLLDRFARWWFRYHLPGQLDAQRHRWAAAFYEAAKKLVARVNGYGRVASAGFRPVKLNGGFSAGDSERRVIFVETIARADGTVVPDAPSPWPGRFALAGKHADLDEVLEIRSRDEPAFTGSANLSEVSGPAARHPRMPGHPRRTMTIAEGRHYIRALATSWLDWLSEAT